MICVGYHYRRYKRGRVVFPLLSLLDVDSRRRIIAEAVLLGYDIIYTRQRRPRHVNFYYYYSFFFLLNTRVRISIKTREINIKHTYTYSKRYCWRRRAACRRGSDWSITRAIVIWIRDRSAVAVPRTSPCSWSPPVSSEIKNLPPLPPKWVQRMIFTGGGEDFGGFSSASTVIEPSSEDFTAPHLQPTMICREQSKFFKRTFPSVFSSYQASPRPPVRGRDRISAPEVGRHVHFRTGSAE